MLGRVCRRGLTRLPSLVREKGAAAGCSASKGCTQCWLEQSMGHNEAPSDQRRTMGSRPGLWTQLGAYQHTRGLASQTSGGDLPRDNPENGDSRLDLHRDFVHCMAGMDSTVCSKPGLLAASSVFTAPCSAGWYSIHDLLCCPVIPAKGG